MTRDKGTSHIRVNARRESLATASTMMINGRAMFAGRQSVSRTQVVARNGIVASAVKPDPARKSGRLLLSLAQRFDLLGYLSAAILSICKLPHIGFRLRTRFVMLIQLFYQS